MKVLYLTDGQSEDYLRDSVFHGLREMLGEQAVDAVQIGSLYQSAKSKLSKMYGGGYSLYTLLPEIPVDREDLPSKIRNRYFDLIIYGSVWRSLPLWDAVTFVYPRDRIFLLDGEDHPFLHPRIWTRGVYFKRELRWPLHRFAHPIHFGIPKEKMLPVDRVREIVDRKTRVLAECDPRDRRTYRFDTEEKYYGQYRDALFGVTTKKAGWDCMRHYEIIAAGAIPYFIDLENAPTHTMHRLPKGVLLNAQSWWNENDGFNSKFSIEAYTWTLHWLLERAHQSLTTHAVAEGLLAVMSSSEKKTYSFAHYRRLLEQMPGGTALVKAIKKIRS